VGWKLRWSQEHKELYAISVVRYIRSIFSIACVSVIAAAAGMQLPAFSSTC
jgi:hypothetical protein